MWVYANYGRVEDYLKLKEKGINVSNTVVLAKHGKIFRGDIVKNAYDEGQGSTSICSPANGSGRSAGDGGRDGKRSRKGDSNGGGLKKSGQEDPKRRKGGCVFRHTLSSLKKVARMLSKDRAE
ncbi:putative glutamate carboxypeptidase, partial [Trifolium medium]|nr:putative glutamate carboxypeptidase [Trifolium medium]